eukprot:120315_1
MYVSASSGTVCQPMDQGLDDYGSITINTSYHLIIAFNSTNLTVHVTGGGKPEWERTWPRKPTHEGDVGQEVPVWWMSNKNDGTPFNLGAGVFTNVVIKSELSDHSDVLSTNNPYSYVFYGAIFFVLFLLILCSIGCHCKYKPRAPSDDHEAFKYEVSNARPPATYVRSTLRDVRNPQDRIHVHTHASTQNSKQKTSTGGQILEFADQNGADLTQNVDAKCTHSE